MKYEAIKHQGQRTDLTSGQFVQKLGSSLEKVAEGTGENYKRIQRVMRLNNLVKPLLDKVDKEEIGFTPAVELSYLKPEEQKLLLEAMAVEQCTPSHSQALRMKKMSQDGQLSLDDMTTILAEMKKPPKKIVEDPSPVPPSIINRLESQDKPMEVSGYIQLPIEPFLKFIPKSLFQQQGPEGQEKLTKLFLKMAELYKKYIEKKRSQVK